jgi:hypothetical protein
MVLDPRAQRGNRVAEIQGLLVNLTAGRDHTAAKTGP